MQATTIPFGTLAIPGGWRYHPAIVAQAGATLARLFPGRLRWLACGSGQALSEAIVGTPWPDKAERNARLEAGVSIIRALWAGETVTRDGPIPVRDATLYTRPGEPAPRLIAAALTPETAAWAGGWADGLVTVAQPFATLREILARFRDGGGVGKPLALQVHLGFGRTDQEARRLAFEQWRANIVPFAVAETLRTPEALEARTAALRAEDIDSAVLVSSDPSRHCDWIEEFASLGFDEIYLHNAGLNQREFLDAFGTHVLPTFAR